MPLPTSYLAELIAQKISQGSQPSYGDSFVFTEIGWVFKPSGGVAVKNQSDELLRGELLSLWKALDATRDEDENPLLIPRAPYDRGSVSGQIQINFSSGGTQRFTLSEDTTVSGISNMISGGWMNLRFSNPNQKVLTFDDSKFEGPILLFTKETIWCSVVDFGVQKIAVMGADL